MITTGPSDGIFSAAESKVPIDGRKPWAGASEATLCAKSSEAPEFEPYNTYSSWLLAPSAAAAKLILRLEVPRGNFTLDGVV